MANSSQPYVPQPARLLCPWDSPGKNTGMGCRALLQGIFLTQGSNPGLLSPVLAARFFTTSTTWEILCFHQSTTYFFLSKRYKSCFGHLFVSYFNGLQYVQHLVCFSLVNLSYVNLIIRPVKEPRSEGEEGPPLTPQWRTEDWEQIVGEYSDLEGKGRREYLKQWQSDLTTFLQLPPPHLPLVTSLISLSVILVFVFQFQIPLISETIQYLSFSI